MRHYTAHVDLRLSDTICIIAKLSSKANEERCNLRYNFYYIKCPIKDDKDISNVTTEL